MLLINYVKSSFRNLWRSRSFSLINIFGLALGMTSSLLIALWIMDEVHVDAFHQNKNRLYTIYKRRLIDGVVRAGYATPGPLPEEIAKVVPELELVSGFDSQPEVGAFQVGDKIMDMSGNYGGEDFFKMFSYPLVTGSPASALATPQSIAISRKMAENFFGDPETATGKSIRFQNRRDFIVTAVFENLPSQTADKFDFLFNYKFLLENVDWLDEWRYSRVRTYVLLREGADPIHVEAKIKNLLSTYDKDQTETFHIELGLQRFDQMYLHGIFRGGVPAGGRIEYVRLFGLVAAFIVIIACINFMNLSTARSLKRAKEVGVRKAIGASRNMLMNQFTGEAILFSFLSMILAVAAVVGVLPAFNTLTSKQVTIPAIGDPTWLYILLAVVLIGVTSGIYPALFLSAMNPIRILKGTLKFSPSSLFLRKGLVVFQFALSILMIIGTIIVSRQVSYIQSADSGFERENLLYIPMVGNLIPSYQTFKIEAARLPGIESVTRASSPPISITNHSFDLDWQGKDPGLRIDVAHAGIGYNFARTMELEILEGRDFSEDFPSDSMGYLINETAWKQIGFKDPIGQPLSLFLDQPKGKVIGVIKDFHFASLYQPIQPLILRFGEHHSWGCILVRVESGRTAEALAGLEKLSKQINPQFPFDYSFLNQEYQTFYKSEQIISKLTLFFAALAIFISCLGLLGLSTFAAEQRTKEIGIRKVMGASVGTIVRLLSSDFLKLVIFSALLAFPVAWWAMNSWLETFAYRIDMGAWVFVLAGTLAVLIAMGTISYNAIKAAVANPVKSLRSE